MASASVGRSLKDRGAAVVANMPLESVLRLLGKWQGVLILNYHRIGECEGRHWDHAMWSLTGGELDKQLEVLTRCAEVIAPEEFQAAMAATRGRRVLLTFDDGYRDNYEIAFPLLCRYGLRAAFFLATGFLDESRVPWWDEIAWMVRHADGDAREVAATPADGDREIVTSLDRTGPVAAAVENATIVKLIDRYRTLPEAQGEPFLERLARDLGSGRCEVGDVDDQWLTWAMARELQAAGMSIGGHTVTHPVLARLSDERQREEITSCARRLNEELGVAMRWFAYPVGGRDTFTRSTQEILRGCGVELAFSYYGGFARPSRWDPFDVPRVHVDRRLAPRLFGSALRPPRPLTRPSL